MSKRIVPLFMPALQRLSRLAVVITVCSLSACASGPPSYRSSSEARLAAEQLATNDDAEIRRRWGTFGDTSGRVFVGQGNNGFLLVSTGWLVKGSVMEMYRRWHEDGKAYTRYWLLQYNPTDSRIDFYNFYYNPAGQVNFHGYVQADGSLRTSLPFGKEVYRFDQTNGTLTVVPSEVSDSLMQVDPSQYQAMVKSMEDRQYLAERAREQRSQAFRQGLYDGLQSTNESLANRTGAPLPTMEGALERAPQPTATPKHALTDTQANIRNQQPATQAQAGNGQTSSVSNGSQASEPSRSTPNATSANNEANAAYARASAKDAECEILPPLEGEQRSLRVSDKAIAIEQLRNAVHLICLQPDYMFGAPSCTEHQETKPVIVGGQMRIEKAPSTWTCTVQYACTKPRRRCDAPAAGGTAQ